MKGKLLLIKKAPLIMAQAINKQNNIRNATEMNPAFWVYRKTKNLSINTLPFNWLLGKIICAKSLNKKNKYIWVHIKREAIIQSPPNNSLPMKMNGFTSSIFSSILNRS